MGISSLFPAHISKPYGSAGKILPEVAEQTGLSPDCEVAVGIHDSNASLLPYLISHRQTKFLLASTGTWCVFMYPGSGYSVKKTDLSDGVLHFIDAFARPLKVVLFKGGAEHDFYTGLIKSKFNIDPRLIKLDVNLVTKILSDCNCFVLPGELKQHIVNEKYFYHDAQTAYTVLCLSLVVQSSLSTKILIKTKSMPVFVEGGFTHNNIYLSLFSSLFKHLKFYTSEIKEATSMGTAICAKVAYEKTPITEFNKKYIKIKVNPIKKLSIDNRLFDGYIRKYEQLMKQK
jgi:sugar (pentulose or hexulose) kinase